MLRFELHHCLVQGPMAAARVIEGLQKLDRDPAVEVIVIARGGGSVEDLLPFSDEGLVRALAAAVAAPEATPTQTGCPAGYQHLSVEGLESQGPYMAPGAIDTAGKSNGFVCGRPLPPYAANADVDSSMGVSSPSGVT